MIRKMCQHDGRSAVLDNKGKGTRNLQIMSQSDVKLLQERDPQSQTKWMFYYCTNILKNIVLIVLYKSIIKTLMSNV
jgi:hypothetical protein